MKKIDFSLDSFLIVGGAGATGTSVINYLQYKLVANDRLVVLQSHKDLTINAIMLADVIILSPGVFVKLPLLEEARSLGKLVVGDIELFAREAKIWQDLYDTKIIGITGSNGKTTCASLTAYLAEELGFKTELAGNIGVPVLDTYLKYAKGNSSENAPQVVILELSSYQLESTSNLYLNSATVLNISEDHLDHGKNDVGYGYSMLEYASAKAKIFDHADVCVLNASDHRVCDMYKEGMSAVWFAQSINQLAQSCRENSTVFHWNNNSSLLGKGIFSDNGVAQYRKLDKLNYNKLIDRIMFGSYNLFPQLNLKNRKLIGSHNIDNILSAISLLDATLDCTDDFETVINNDDFETMINKFESLPHRINIYKNLNYKNLLPHIINSQVNSQVSHNVFFIDDSKATNIDATRVSLQMCQELFGDRAPIHSCHLILGGDAKGQNLSQLTRICEKYFQMIASISIIGKDKDLISSSVMRAKEDWYPSDEPLLENDNEIICKMNDGKYLSTHNTLSQAICAIQERIAKDSESDILTSTVLLAPACASTDQYKNYSERGDDFINNVKKYYQIERWK